MEEEDNQSDSQTVNTDSQTSQETETTRQEQLHIYSYLAQKRRRSIRRVITRTYPRTNINSILTPKGESNKEDKQRFNNRAPESSMKLTQLEKCVFLDGVSCTFKSTILQRLHSTSSEYAIQWRDVAEDAKVNPELSAMHEVGAIEIVYLMDYMLKFDTSKMVHDRTWFAGVVYHIVANSTVETCKATCKRVRDAISYEVLGHLQRLKVIVLVESRPARNVARMQQRSYVIDRHLDEDYVRKQNIAFTYFADQFKWIVMYQARREPNAYFQARVAQSLKIMIGWVNADMQNLIRGLTLFEPLEVQDDRDYEEQLMNDSEGEETFQYILPEARPKRGGNSVQRH